MDSSLQYASLRTDRDSDGEQLEELSEVDDSDIEGWLLVKFPEFNSANAGNGITGFFV
jgi:hypothetical protein